MSYTDLYGFIVGFSFYCLPASASGSFLRHASMSSLPTRLQVRLHVSAKVFPNEENTKTREKIDFYFSRCEWNKTQLTSCSVKCCIIPYIYIYCSHIYILTKMETI